MEGFFDSQNTLNFYASAYKNDFSYDLDNHFLLKRTCQRTLELASQGSALDLGVGHGLSLHAFSEFFKHYEVVEGSEIIIQQFLEKHSEFKGRIIHTLFENYETTHRFDFIIMNFVLEHVRDPLSLLRKFKKFLTENGSIFIAVPNFEALNKRIALEAGLIKDMSTLSDADRQLGHYRLFNVESLKVLMEEAGLKIQSLEGIFLKPFTSAQLQSLNLSSEIWKAMTYLGKDYPELSVGILAKVSL